MKNFLRSLGRRSEEGNLSVEMCSHDFFLKHALLSCCRQKASLAEDRFVVKMNEDKRGNSRKRVVT